MKTKIRLGKSVNSVLYNSISGSVNSPFSSPINDSILISLYIPLGRSVYNLVYVPVWSSVVLPQEFRRSSIWRSVKNSIRNLIRL